MDVEVEPAAEGKVATVVEDFGRYQLLELLGEGGMGRVYRAYDTLTERAVALKVLSPHLAQDRVFQQRFRREAEVAARLADPHIVPIHQYGEINGRLYVDMRLVEGRDLGSVIAEDGPLEADRAVAIVEQVAEALAAAHTQSLVHRDIKPSNILLTKHDFAYLIDFGIAWVADQTRMTSAGSAIGTFAYMAPERFSSNEVDPLWDVYALACVLYECLTGRQPFPGESIPQQIAAHITAPPPRPSEKREGVPETLDDVIAAGMAKNPALRHQTAFAFGEAARAAVGIDEPQVDEPEVTVSHRLPDTVVRPTVPEAPPTEEIHETLAAIPSSVEQAPVALAEPEIAEPEPVEPDPAEPEPVEPDPAEPEPEPAAETRPAAVDLVKRTRAKQTPAKQPARELPTPELSQPSPRRRPMFLAAVALFVLVLGGSVFAATMGGDTQPSPVTTEIPATTAVRSSTAPTTTRSTAASTTRSTTVSTTPSAATISTTQPAPQPTFTPTQSVPVTQAPVPEPVVTQTQEPVPPPVTETQVQPSVVTVTQTPEPGVPPPPFPDQASDPNMPVFTTVEGWVPPP